MTCIVGYVEKENKKVLIGADSAAGSGTNVIIRKDSKVFRVSDFVIGCTSSFRMIQLLRYSFTPPKIYDKDVYEYMCTDFINAVRTCFKDGGFIQKWSDGDEKGGVFLVGYKDRLFFVSNDFQVGETVQGYDSCGCGDRYALGSIFSNKKTSAKEIVIDALKAASYFSGHVCEPFSILETHNS